VEFERELAAALERTGDRTRLATTDPRHLGSAAAGDARNPNHVTPRQIVAARNDGNRVSIDEEMALLAETQLRYQALTTTVARRLATLRGVIRG